jgi:peptide/nickel transport system substrate-binding protein/oligopeptide transport system substrate-binding protein
MNYAVNKDKIVRLIFGTGVTARGVLPPNMPGHDPTLTGYPYDPAAARRLLREAGYPDGFESTLWIRSAPDSLQVAQGVQQDLKDVGIRITIKAVAWGALLEAVRSPRLVPLFLLGWEADFPDPSNFLEVLFHSRSIGSNNNTHYRNVALDRLLEEAATTRDEATRFGILRRAERLVVEEAPWIFLYYPVTHYVIDSRVRNFRLHPFRPPRYQGVALGGAE